MKKLRFKSIAEVRKKNIDAGYYFFKTLPERDSKIEGFYDGRFLIVSDEVPQYGRIYQIWEAYENGRILKDLNNPFKNLEEAEFAVKELFGPLLETRQVLEI